MLHRTCCRLVSIDEPSVVPFYPRVDQEVTGKSLAFSRAECVQTSRGALHAVRLTITPHFEGLGEKSMGSPHKIARISSCSFLSRGLSVSLTAYTRDLSIRAAQPAGLLKPFFKDNRKNQDARPEAILSHLLLQVRVGWGGG